MKLLRLLISLCLLTGGSAVADPLRPGGSFTHSDLSKNAFSHPGPAITKKQGEEFFLGNSFFRSAWVAAPSSTTGRDGLGPTYNATACAACHVLDGRGLGIVGDPGSEKVNLSLLIRLSEKTPQGIVHHQDYGDQLNPLALQGVPGEASVGVVFESVEGRFADGSTYRLRKPTFVFKDFSLRPFDANTLVSPRVAPHMIGLGLIEAIAESDIVAGADILDANGDGISGKANYIADVASHRLALGRFGWKASQPSLLQQNAAAFLGDMGLTTTVFPEQNCPVVQIECLNTISGGDPEIDDKILGRVTEYSQLLGVPARRDPQHIDVIAGEKLFRQVGCTSCHRESFVTGGDHPTPELRGQTIYPYSDFLLHDMGEDLADHRPDGLADGREWRTPPLWGIGLFLKVSKHQNLLHDARARGVEEAVLWHGGEAQAARDAYVQLNSDQRRQVVVFVNSL